MSYNCEKALENISAYVDGELGIIESIKLKIHTLLCKECREELEFEKRILASMSSETFFMPHKFNEELHKKLETEYKKNPVKVERKLDISIKAPATTSFFEWFNDKKAYFAVAACLLIFVFAISSFQLGTTDNVAEEGNAKTEMVYSYKGAARTANIDGVTEENVSSQNVAGVNQNIFDKFRNKYMTKKFANNFVLENDTIGYSTTKSRGITSILQTIKEVVTDAVSGETPTSTARGPQVTTSVSNIAQVSETIHVKQEETKPSTQVVSNATEPEPSTQRIVNVEETKPPVYEPVKFETAPVTTITYVEPAEAAEKVAVDMREKVPVEVEDESMYGVLMVNKAADETTPSEASISKKNNNEKAVAARDSVMDTATNTSDKAANTPDIVSDTPATASNTPVVASNITAEQGNKFMYNDVYNYSSYSPKTLLVKTASFSAPAANEKAIKDVLYEFKDNIETNDNDTYIVVSIDHANYDAFVSRLKLSDLCTFNQTQGRDYSMSYNNLVKKQSALMTEPNKYDELVEVTEEIEQLLGKISNNTIKISFK